jgi:hypothetical protein
MASTVALARMEETRHWWRPDVFETFVGLMRMSAG